MAPTPRQVFVRHDPARGWVCQEIGGHQAEEPITVVGDGNDPETVRQAVETHVGASVVKWQQTMTPDGGACYTGTVSSGARDLYNFGSGFGTWFAIKSWWRKRKQSGGGHVPPPPPPPG